MGERMTTSADAERDVLGAILKAASLGAEPGHRIFDRALATGLRPSHFHAALIGELYGTLGLMRGRDLPLDPLSVSVELERVDSPRHTRAHLGSLAHEVTAFNLIEHRAGIVIAAAKARLAKEAEIWG
jgi:replicative DNA helicase